MSEAHSHYYVPHGTYWPIVGSLALFSIVIGVSEFLLGQSWGTYVAVLGGVLLAVMMFGWFGTVVRESVAGLYNKQVDHSFRWGMSFFIFSEVMFFGAFFGALFYVHEFSVPWLSGQGAKGIAHLLWPNFFTTWPTNGPGAIGGPFDPMSPLGLPAINTAILLSSGVTVTIAHWGILKNRRMQFILGLAATVTLGLIFLWFQAHEFLHAYTVQNLTLHSGIYGSTFFMLTGFHGAHVTIGAIMLTVMLVRAIRGHFDSEHHFGFEAAAWYWHFVDVVWLGLYIFVYWL